MVGYKEMKTIRNSWIWIGILCLVYACQKNEGRDDRVVDMALLTEKTWYYNAWAGDAYGLDLEDLLEALRLERGGIFKTVDFGGRQEGVAGTWENTGNVILLKYNAGKQVEWNVQRSGADYMTVMVNQQGVREYRTDLGYLDNLTADAYLVNEYTEANHYRTRLGADVRGNVNLREAFLITGENEYASMENHGFYWTERNTGQVFDVDGTFQEIRFYLRIGKNEQVKLRDLVTDENLPERLPEEMELSADSKNSALHVSWLPYEGAVYYRVEVFPENMDLTKPYFVSRVQPRGTRLLKIQHSTAGELNKWTELVRGGKYVVRLTALLFERGVDVVNDEYSYANLQAVSYFTKEFVWE